MRNVLNKFFTFFSGLFFLALFGCANPYAKFYTGAQDARLMPNYVNTGGPIKIYTSNDFKSDIESLQRKGYTVIGNSSFSGTGMGVSESNIKAQAEKVGAQIVLVSSKYSHTMTGAMPLTIPTTSTSFSTGSATVTNGFNSPMYINGNSTTTTIGSQTVMTPYSVDRYDYGAIYLAKVHFLLGVFTAPLDDEMKRRIQSNMGAYISNVVEGSPAYAADILKGDILLKINGRRIESPAQFLRDIPQYRGQMIHIFIDRDGRNIEKDIQL